MQGALVCGKKFSTLLIVGVEMTAYLDSPMLGGLSKGFQALVQVGKRYLDTLESIRLMFQSYCKHAFSSSSQTMVVGCCWRWRVCEPPANHQSNVF